MRPIDERAIRASFRNASRKEASSLNMPIDFDEIDFEEIDFLGWYDPKMRTLPPLAYEGYDRELAREMRILRLREHVASFVRELG
jgi:hypothetical protein